MNFLEEIIRKIKIISEKESIVPRVILPESSEIRIIKAGILASNNVKIILVSNEKIKSKNDLLELDIDQNLKDIVNNNYDKTLFIINKNDKNLQNLFANELYNLRKEKGITLYEAKKIIEDEVYFSTLALKLNYADALVSGSIHSTKETLKPALQIIKAKKEAKIASSFFIMEIPNYSNNKGGIYLFSDCGMIENPTSEQLTLIAKSSAKTYQDIVGKKAKVALLSYSTKGSADSDLVKKVVEAKKILDIENSKEELNFIYDGEIQLDAAIIPEIANAKDKDSKLKGEANVLIFPDLNSGNIGYKLVQRFANAKAYGPICQGLNKITNDLSRGSSVEDILGVIYISALQSLQNN